MQREAEIVNPPAVRNRLYHWAGAMALLANKVRYTVRPYHRPRDFGADEISRGVDYDFSVVESWLGWLGRCGVSGGVKDKVVLELGVGPDLGTGLILLAMGARRYVAMDVNDLASGAAAAFYEELLRQIARRDDIPADVDALAGELELVRGGGGGRLDYRCRKDFDISTIGSRAADVIFSQAAMEHFDDVKAAAAQTAEVAREGAVLIARIDLRTHTRWLRRRDPLNIYRYSSWAYRLLKFRGSPNRLRPRDYVSAFEEGGWSDVHVRPVSVLSGEYVARVQPSLAGPFRRAEAQMEALSIVLCARKGGAVPDRLVDHVAAGR